MQLLLLLTNCFLLHNALSLSINKNVTDTVPESVLQPRLFKNYCHGCKAGSRHPLDKWMTKIVSQVVRQEK